MYMPFQTSYRNSIGEQRIGKDLQRRRILKVATLSGSTAVPLNITNAGASKIAENYTAGGLAFGGTAVLTYPTTGQSK